MLERCAYCVASHTIVWALSCPTNFGISKSSKAGLGTRTEHNTLPDGVQLCSDTKTISTIV